MDWTRRLEELQMDFKHQSMKGEQKWGREMKVMEEERKGMQDEMKVGAAE